MSVVDGRTATPAPPPLQAPPQQAPVSQVVAEHSVVESRSEKPRRDWLEVPSVRLSLGVTTYDDCQGSEPLTRVTAARNSCAPPTVPFLMGHNPGVFSPLVGARVGDGVSYWDGSGSEHDFRLTSIDRVPQNQVWEHSGAPAKPHLVMITCAVADGSVDWVFQGEPT